MQQNVLIGEAALSGMIFWHYILCKGVGDEWLTKQIVRDIQEFGRSDSILKTYEEPAIVALRERVKTTLDAGVKTEQVGMTITLRDGRTLQTFIEHARGSVEVPLTDRQLEEKFTDLAEGILPAAQTSRLMQACWQVEQLPSAAEIAKAAVPA